MSSQLAFVETSDKARIAVDYRPIAGAPVLMLSNSLGTDLAMWDVQMKAWEGELSLLRYDTRGHGGSDCPAGAYSIDRLAQDVLDILDSLAIDRAHFCGLSLGGMTGQRLSWLAPERFNSMTLAATSAYMGPPSTWQSRIETIAQEGMQAIAERTLGVWFTDQYRANQADFVAQMKATFLATNVAGYAGCCAAIRDMDMRASAQLNPLPTLVIAGAQDLATPAEHSEYLASQVAAARMVKLNGGHLVNFEQSAQFASAVANFALKHDQGV